MIFSISGLRVLGGSKWGGEQGWIDGNMGGDWKKKGKNGENEGKLALEG